jgi:hypothetical protein
MSLGRSFVCTLHSIRSVFDPDTCSDADLVDMTEALKLALRAVSDEQLSREIRAAGGIPYIALAADERRRREREGGR